MKNCLLYAAGIALLAIESCKKEDMDVAESGSWKINDKSFTASSIVRGAGTIAGAQSIYAINGNDTLECAFQDHLPGRSESYRIVNNFTAPYNNPVVIILRVDGIYYGRVENNYPFMTITTDAAGKIRIDVDEISIKTLSGSDNVHFSATVVSDKK